MIIGIGIDIIKNHRIETVLNKFGNKFKKRCFTKHEIMYSEKKINFTNYFAKKYSAKEACSKALGTGMTKGISWKDIEIKNSKTGKPFIVLHGQAKKELMKLSKKKCEIKLSISDEKEYSITNVIIFENEK